LTAQQTYSLISLGILIALALYLFWLRRTQEFYWNDFWYAFPLTGKLSRSIRRKDLHPVQDEVTGSSSTAAQQELLATYFNHIGVVTRERFQRAYIFLLLAKQADRRPMPIWGMPFLFILLVAEALGFGLLLAPFVASEITPNSAQIIGFVIAFVMAIIAAGLTHAAGQEIYETGLIRKMRKVANDTKSALYKTAIANDEDQSIDAGEPDVTRFGNRILESVEDRGSIKFIIVAAIFVLIVLGASTVLRYENLRLAVTQQSALAGAPDASAPDASAPDSTATNSGNPFATIASPLPPDVTQDAQAAQSRVQAEENYEQILGGTAGIIGLGVIFLFTQVYSTSLGIQWGHIKRRRVEAAYMRGTLGFSSYDDYKRHQLDPRIRRSERRLQQLRSGLFGDSHLAPSTFTFRSWMDAKLALEAEHLSFPSRVIVMAGFNAEREAEAVIAIADPEARRSQLRQKIAGLAPVQVQQLQNAIAELKRRQARDAWIDDV
jgi:hypothetical protein